MPSLKYFTGIATVSAPANSYGSTSVDCSDGGIPVTIWELPQSSSTYVQLNGSGVPIGFNVSLYNNSGTGGNVSSNYLIICS